MSGPSLDHAYDFHSTLRAWAAQPTEVPEFQWLGHLIDYDTSNSSRLFAGWSKNENGRLLNMDGFCRALWFEPAPPTLTFHPGGQFAVCRERVRRQPISSTSAPYNSAPPFWTLPTARTHLGSGFRGGGRAPGAPRPDSVFEAD